MRAALCLAAPAAFCLWLLKRAMAEPPLVGLRFALEARRWLGALRHGAPHPILLPAGIHGPGTIIWAMPFVALMGLNSRAIVAADAACALGGVLITAAIGRRLYGTAAGLLAAALLATTWSYVTFNAAGLWLCSIGVDFSLLAIWAALAYRDTGRRRFAGLAGAAIGAALLSYSSHFALAAGLAAWAALDRAGFRRAAARRPGVAAASAFLASVTLAVALLAWTLARYGSADLSRLFQIASDGRHLLKDYPSALLTRTRQALALFGGDSAWQFHLATPPPAWPLWPFGGALAAAAALAAARGARSSWRRLLPFVVGAVFWALSPLSPHYLADHHLQILLPLQALAIAGATVLAPPGRRAFARGAIILLVAVNGFHALSAVRTLEADSVAPDRALQALIARLSAEQRPVCVFGGEPPALELYADAIRFYTADRLDAAQVSDPDDGDADLGRALAFVTAKRATVVVSAAGRQSRAWKAWLALLRGNGMRTELQWSIPDEHETAFDAYRVAPAAAPAAPTSRFVDTRRPT